MNRPVELVARVAAGERRAAAKLISAVEDEDPGHEEALAALLPHTGKAHLVGVTGPPGAGKSTLVDCLIEHYREAGEKVGVLAVDPTSPFSGGAILGDRIRMTSRGADPGVFIRSMGSRGHLGGLARATLDCARVLDAWGARTILIETVGVGQGEVEVASLADSTIVVSVPGLGDEVQAMKAGLMEVADVFCVNKADRDGADRVAAELEMLTGLVTEHGADDWFAPIVRTVAERAEGIDGLVDALARHQDWLTKTGAGNRRRVARARQEILALAAEDVRRRAERESHAELLSGLADAVAARRTPSREAARRFLAA